MITIPYNNVAVTPLFDATISSGGIIIPDSATERCDQGIVKYVGPQCKWVKAGDHVLFSGYSGTLISLEDEGKLIILPENFCICIINPPDTNINGLYFKGIDGDYFPATYEMALELMARAFENETWFQDRHRDPKTGKLNIKQSPSNEKYLFTGHVEPEED